MLGSLRRTSLWIVVMQMVLRGKASECTSLSMHLIGRIHAEAMPRSEPML